jgi:hypothetical protein
VLHVIWANINYVFFSMVQQPPVGQGLCIIEASRSHSDTPQSVGQVISRTQRPLPDKTQQSWHTSMSPAGFEPTILASEWPQTYALDGAATGIGNINPAYWLLTFLFINITYCYYNLVDLYVPLTINQRWRYVLTPYSSFVKWYFLRMAKINSRNMSE